MCLQESKLHINYLESGLPGPKRVSRQHHSCCQHEQGRRHEIGPIVCHTVENPDLVLQEADDSQGLTHSMPTECGSRQAMQAWSDHPKRVVSLSRGLPVDMHQLAPTTDGPVCNDSKQQVTSVCVTISRFYSLSSKCTQSTLRVSGPKCLPTNSYSW